MPVDIEDMLCIIMGRDQLGMAMKQLYDLNQKSENNVRYNHGICSSLIQLQLLVF